MRIVLGITGGSGVQYSIRIIDVLTSLGHKVELVISKGAEKVFEVEVQSDYIDILNRATVTYDVKDVSAPIASGTHINDGMIIVPCSMKTVGAIAAGYTENLIQRAADCMLKEGRKLLLIFRETPLNLIHLRNLNTLKEAGAIIMPASPGFYYNPQSVADLVDFVVGKALNIFGIKHTLFNPWNPKSVKMKK